MSIVFCRLTSTPTSLWESGFNFSFIGSIFLFILLVGTASFLLLFHQFYSRDASFTYEFPLFILFATFGYSLVIGCSSFITLYLSLELSAFCLYILAATRRTSIFSTEAGLKYFLLGALASSFLLLGTSLLYGLGGSVRFEDWSILIRHWGDLPETGLFWLALILIGVGLLTKLSVAPFHFWTPDVYDGAPAGVVAYFSSIAKIAPLASVAQLLYGPLFPLLPLFSSYLLAFGLLSVLVGTLGALKQQRIKRLLAYSGIAHSGYMLLGIAVGHQLGLISVLLYISIYVLLSIDFFASIFSLISYSGRKIRNVDNLLVVSRTSPFSSFFLASNLFSFAGVPPFIGFFPKFFILVSLVIQSYYISAISLVIISVLATVYYVRLVRVIYFDRPMLWAFYRPPAQSTNFVSSASFFANLLLLPLFSIFSLFFFTYV